MRFERWKEAGDGPSSSPIAGGPESSARSEPEKMVLLYLPGIEGLGTSVEPQLPALSSKFDVFRLIIGAEDRSTFTTLSTAVRFPLSFSREAPLQPLCFIGSDRPDCQVVDMRICWLGVQVRGDCILTPINGKSHPRIEFGVALGRSLTPSLFHTLCQYLSRVGTPMYAYFTCCSKSLWYITLLFITVHAIDRTLFFCERCM